MADVHEATLEEEHEETHENAGEGAGGDGAKRRKRRTKLETLEKAVADLDSTILKKRGLAEVIEGGGILSSSKIKSLQTLKEQIESLLQKRAVKSKEFEEEQEKKKLEAEAAAARAQKKLEQEELTKVFSAAGVLALVEIRLSLESEFEKGAAKHKVLWEKVKDRFDALIALHDLPASDGRSAEALKTRWSLELGEFRLWCDKARRAIQYSGVPADQVEERVTEHWRPTSALFRKANYDGRPMSSTPWSCSGESAHTAGVGSPFGAEGAAAAAAAAAAAKQCMDAGMGHDAAAFAGGMEDAEDAEDAAEYAEAAAAAAADVAGAAAAAADVTGAAAAAAGAAGVQSGGAPAASATPATAPTTKGGGTAAALREFSKAMTEQGRLQREHEENMLQQCKQQ
jgi:hypothetical protein